jgi:Na+/melibiose symporter-like transporter
MAILLERRFAGLWRNPDFMKLWIGQTISTIGTCTDALGYTAILVLGASPAQMGVMTAVADSPFLLMALAAGVWVDRLRRRPIMIAADVGRAVLLITVPAAAALGQLSMGQVIVVGFLVGILSLLFDLAHSSYLPWLVEPEEIIEGNSKLEMSGSAAAIAGPGLAGFLVQILTAPVAVLVDALTFACSALSLGLIRRPEPASPLTVERRSAWGELVEGLSLVWSNPVLRALTVSAGTRNIFRSFFGTLYGLYLIRVLGIGPTGVGLSLATGGIGGLLGALAAQPVARRIGSGRTIVESALTFSAVTMLYPLAGGPVVVATIVVMVAQLLDGLVLTVYAIHVLSLRQRITPDRLLGRANASINAVELGVIPVGLLIAGILGQVLGVRAALWLAAFGTLLSLPWLWFSPVREDFM